MWDMPDRVVVVAGYISSPVLLSPHKLVTLDFGRHAQLQRACKWLLQYIGITQGQIAHYSFHSHVIGTPELDLVHVLHAVVSPFKLARSPENRHAS